MLTQPWQDELHRQDVRRRPTRASVAMTPTVHHPQVLGMSDQMATTLRRVCVYRQCGQEAAGGHLLLPDLRTAASTLGYQDFALSLCVFC